MLVGRERLLCSESQQLREKVDSCPQANSPLLIREQELFKKIFIYLKVRSWLRHAGFSGVVVQGFTCPGAWGILVPKAGIEPRPPALEGQFLTAGLPGKSQNKSLKGESQEGGRWLCAEHQSQL